MIKFREKCLYCDKPLDAKNIRKTYCNDKCRMAYGRQIVYEKRNKEIVKEALKVEPNIEIIEKVSVAKNKVEVKKVLSEQPKKINPFEGWDEIKNTDEEIKNLNLKTQTKK